MNLNAINADLIDRTAHLRAMKALPWHYRNRRKHIDVAEESLKDCCVDMEIALARKARARA